MKNILHILIIILTSVLLGSCVPGKTLTIEKLTPAEITLPDNIRNVLVLNASYYPSLDTLAFNYVSELKPEDQFIVDTLVNNNVFNGLFSILDASPASYLNDSPYFEARGTEKESFLKPLSGESIQYLCDSFQVDGIISFEYYAFDPDVRNEFYSGEDYYGTMATLSIKRYLLWRIYEYNEGLIKENFMQDTLNWYGYGVGNEARKDLPELADAVREAFWYAGYEFGKSISPSWENEKRYYFEFRNKKGEDISQGPDELKEYALTGRKNKAYQASYNLAVFHERSDELEEAMTWINRAIFLRPDAAVALYYKRQLEKRLKESKKLDQQMSPLQ